MAKVTTSQFIAAEPAAVFAAFTDLENTARVVNDILKVEMLTGGPVAIGTRFRETRMMFGKECTEEMEICLFEPDKVYGVRSESCGAVFQSTFHFHPEASGTRVDFEMEVRPQTFFAKLMSPLSSLMMGSVRTAINKDIQAVKQKLEAEGYRTA